MVDSGSLAVAENVQHCGINGTHNNSNLKDIQDKKLKMNSSADVPPESGSSSPELVEESSGDGRQETTSPIVVEALEEDSIDQQSKEVICISEEDEDQENGDLLEANGSSTTVSGESSKNDPSEVELVDSQLEEQSEIDQSNANSIEKTDLMNEIEIIELSSSPIPTPVLEVKSKGPAVDEGNTKIVNNNESSATLKHNKVVKILDGKTANNNVVLQNCVERIPALQESPKEENHTPKQVETVGLSEENRKVEPLKINLNREPIRTVIKLPSSSATDSTPSSPKITIKPLKPPPDVDHPPVNSIPKLTIKQVIHSNESSYNATATGTEQMQIIPKLLIKNSSSDGSGADGTEPHIVPKLTIRGVNHSSSPTIVSSINTLSSDSVSKSTSVSTSISSPPMVPKLTIKKDLNHLLSSHAHHPPHHNNRLAKDETVSANQPPIPKLLIKPIPDPSASSSNSETTVTPVLTSSEGVKLTIKPIPEPPAASSSSEADIPAVTVPVLTSSEGVKLTIKPIPEPPLPKLTIKTNSLDSNDASVVSSTSNSFSPKVVTPQPASPSDQNSSITSTIPKLTIKPIPKPPPIVSRDPAEVPIPKLTIKPIPPKPSPSEDSCSSETSINSLESSPISSSSSAAGSTLSSPPSVVPKLTIKVPKENDSVVTSLPQLSGGSNVTITSMAAIPTIPVVTKLNIKPIPPQPKESELEKAPAAEPKSKDKPELSDLSKSPVTVSIDFEEPEPSVISKLTTKTTTDIKNLEKENIVKPKVTVKSVTKQDAASEPVCADKSATPPSSTSLEVTTSTNSKLADSGCDSPRIILKINKGSSCTTTTTTTSPTPVVLPISPVLTKTDNKIDKSEQSVDQELKRPAEDTTVKSSEEPEAKKLKLTINHVMSESPDPIESVSDNAIFEGDVIVIDDDSKSDNNEDPLTTAAEPEQKRSPPPLIEISKVNSIAVTPVVAATQVEHETENKSPEKVAKIKRARPVVPAVATQEPETRPRRAAALQVIPASVLLRRNPTVTTPPPLPALIPVVPPVTPSVTPPVDPLPALVKTNITSVLLIENEDGSSSDCMIVDDPLNLVDKNGTCSNSNSNSSFNVPSHTLTETPTLALNLPIKTTLAETVLPPVGRMSTRSGHVPQPKEATHKASDKDSGLDEGKADSEECPTPAKRARGRPKRIRMEPSVVVENNAETVEALSKPTAVEIMLEANGETSSSELPAIMALTKETRGSPRVLLKALTPSRLDSAEKVSPGKTAAIPPEESTVIQENNDSTTMSSSDQLSVSDEKSQESSPVQLILTPKTRGVGRGRGRGGGRPRGSGRGRGRGKLIETPMTEPRKSMEEGSEVPGISSEPPARRGRGRGNWGGRGRAPGRGSRGGRGRGRGSRGGSRSNSASPQKSAGSSPTKGQQPFGEFATPDVK
ncbi:mucin-2-like, partial [Uranotaenia lowii]|uniref:mucin-2-like n=1 Tax=Uranotaenia lowii TaxID=190385 RepID=UPI002478E19F